MRGAGSGSATGGASGDWRTPVVLGIAAFLAFPSVTAYSDVGSLLSGSASGRPRWDMHLTTAPAGSVQSAEMAFREPILAGSSSSSAGIALPDGRLVSFRGKIGAPETTPDEDRVTRALKRRRVLAVAPIQPPAPFAAGSLFDRQTSMIDTRDAAKDRMAFVKPRIDGKEVEVATAFYHRKAVPGTASLFAGLVSNPQPDILATAFTEEAPDYSRLSPFASILRDDNRQGRFIPPAPRDDPNHAWVATALPASAFEASEQRCLAAAVYFEARGEPVKGQAAVAQVVLNRVRNPAYPPTICGVVYQNEDWRNRCQFSFACDGVRERIADRHHWKIAEKVAMAVTSGQIWLSDVGPSTHYHAVYVHPRWARDMKKVDRIGRHVFYETHNGGWN